MDAIPTITSLDHQPKDGIWLVGVKAADGRTGKVQISLDAFSAMTTNPLGQVMLGCWLLRALS